MTEHFLMYSWKNGGVYVQLEEMLESLCTETKHCLLAACHVSGIRKERRGEEKIAGEDRMLSPVAWLGLGKRKGERRKEVTKRNVTSG